MHTHTHKHTQSNMSCKSASIIQAQLKWFYWNLTDQLSQWGKEVHKTYQKITSELVVNDSSQHVPETVQACIAEEKIWNIKQWLKDVTVYKMYRAILVKQPIFENKSCLFTKWIRSNLRCRVSITFMQEHMYRWKCTCTHTPHPHTHTHTNTHTHTHVYIYENKCICTHQGNSYIHPWKTIWPKCKHNFYSPNFYFLIDSHSCHTTTNCHL